MRQETFTSEATTRGLKVHVEARYDPNRSDLEKGKWFFLYTVTLSNQGSETVQLESRHWIITDGEGRVQEVKGPGVVGENPILAPGESYRYTSGCALDTPFGSMHGTYQMTTTSGGRFDAEIAKFTLSEPYTVN